MFISIPPNKKASLVQREVAWRSHDGGIVCTYCRFVDYSKW